MDYQAIKFWIDIFQMVMIAAIGIQQWLYRRNSATISSINRVEEHSKEKIGDLNLRVTRLEEFTKHIPTHQDLGEIHEKINAVYGALKELTGSINHISKSLDRLYENELAKGNSK